MNSNSANNINSNNLYFNNEKIESTEESNHILLKDLKVTIDELEKEKLETEERIRELKERIIDLNIVNNKEKLESLEIERDKMKKKASDSLIICSKIAEELIILRDKLDRYKHNNEK